MLAGEILDWTLRLACAHVVEQRVNCTGDSISMVQDAQQGDAKVVPVMIRRNLHTVGLPVVAGGAGNFVCAGSSSARRPAGTADHASRCGRRSRGSGLPRRGGELGAAHGLDVVLARVTPSGNQSRSLTLPAGARSS
jgi:hypothetical protein